MIKPSDYLRYLISSKATQAVIVSAHKDFLQDYLKEQHQKSNFIKRWLRYEGQLNQIELIKGLSQSQIRISKQDAETNRSRHLSHCTFLDTAAIKPP